MMAPVSPDADCRLIVQLSDSHLPGDRRGRYRGEDTYRSFERILQLVQHNHRDVARLLITGDLSQDGSVASYREIYRCLRATGLAVSVLPGNHDIPAAMREVFPADWLQPVIDMPHWRIVLLDTSVADAEYGCLSETQLVLLDEALMSDKDRHLLIAMHHPPIAVGSRWLDEIGLRNAQALFDRLPARAGEKILLWGHIHQEYAARRPGLRLLGTPSTALQFLPGSDTFALDTQMPGYRWLRLYRQGDAQSAVVRLVR